eukprot:scaffold1230_cov97-Skeletonema_dohrnii-CCMP3373.AAC.12
MEKPSTSSKRPREEEKEGGVEQSAASSSYLQNFLEYDTDKLAAVGRHDVKVVADLESFCGKLQASIAAVKNARDDEEKARMQKEKAIQDEIHDKKAREEQNKIDKQAREEKTKIRRQLVAEKCCFQCKAVGKGLNACVEFTHGGGESGDGVIFCDDCYEIVGIRSCPSCSSFFHKSLGEDSCCKVDCMDDCYTCKSCGEIWCLPCAEADGAFFGRHCECDSWYCNGCADDNIERDCCYKCYKEDIYCGECSYNKSLEKCEGECENLLCDGCVCRLACGNDVRLCGDCDYDCADCDMCEGYYGHSRWA